jgi:hypothetical protein
MELDAIARWLNFCYISIRNGKNKFRASNTSLNSTEYAITRKEHKISSPKHLARTQQQ